MPSGNVTWWIGPVRPRSASTDRGSANHASPPSTTSFVVLDMKDLLLPDHRELEQALECHVLLGPQLVHRLGEPQGGHAPEHGAEHHLELHAPEVLPDAPVGAGAEG